MFIPDAPDQRQPPLAAGELIANFSRQERLALYEYTLKNAAGVAPPPELSMMVCILHITILLYIVGFCFIGVV